jgi:hypothetical protein
MMTDPRDHDGMICVIMMERGPHVVLGTSGVTLLEPGSYTVKRSFNFNVASGMYPDVVPDGKGGFLLTGSEGLFDSSGRMLWSLKSESFRQLVAIGISGGKELAFFSKHIHDRIERHDMAGKVLWTVKVSAMEIGPYATADGEPFLLAIVPGTANSLALRLYDLDGSPRKEIPLPNWGSNVQEIGWPSRGHLLAGSGSWLGVFDANGKEVLRHVIRGTSFNPYHGPDGTAVRLDPVEEPYLAVMSHGSSGYARSVLLVFDPKGRLVWQEEVNKLRAILAVPQAYGKGEVLLVGGMDGVIEYSLARASAANRQLQKGAPSSASLKWYRTPFSG